MSSDASITSRAASPKPITITQQHHTQQTPYYAIPGDDESSASLHHSASAFGASQDFAAAASQHSLFNVTLHPPPLGVDTLPSTYPVRDVGRIFDSQVYPGITREYYPLTEASQLPQTAPQDPQMRYPHHVGLPVLSAETYGDGHQLTGLFSRQPRKDLSAAEDPSSSSRKRVRENESLDRHEIKEEKKRARGRPRLNPKDQTAAEVSPTISLERVQTIYQVLWKPCHHAIYFITASQIIL